MSGLPNAADTLIFSLTGNPTNDQAAQLPGPEFLSSVDGLRLLRSLETSDGVMKSPVQFIGSRSAEGTSTLARDFSLMCSRDLNLKVLLLDLEAPGELQWKFFRDHLSAAHTHVAEFPDSSKELVQIAAALNIHEIGSSRFFVNQRTLPNLPKSAYWRVIFAVLQENFDLIVIDGAPLERTFDGVRLAAQVATNILVVEAEATRSAVSQNLRNRIEDLGGDITGCIVNKRRFYIPNWLYRWL
jgi:Mrp family chromosome partitioning ATPase